jgi:multiple sugar transport system substrate-binding protein
LRLILGLALCLALPGCDQQPPAVTIDFWAMGREGELVRALTEDFERQHPGIRVRVQQVPWSAAHEKLLTAYAGDAMPDVFQLGNTWVPEFVALDAITPLDEWIDATPSLGREDFFPGITATNEIDGRLYGIPWYVDTRLLFYRSDLLGDRDPPRSWDDWRATMAAMQQAAGPGADAIMLPSNEWAPTVILALQMGAELLAGEDECGNFTAAGFRTALAFQLSLFEDGFASALTSGQMVNLYQEFAGGRFAMYITGPWNLAEFARRLPANLQDSWSTAPMPSPDAEYPGVSLAGGASLAIQRQSEYQEEALQLVEYLSATAQQVRFHELSGNLPARIAAWDDPALAGDARTAAFFAQLQRVRATPKIPEWERIATAISRRVEQLVRGETTLDLAVQALDAEVDVMLEKRRWLLDRADPERPFAGDAERCAALRAAS